MVEHVLGQDIDGLFVCGSTGEGPSLTARERRSVAEAHVDACAGRVPVIVHVGHNSLEEARALAEHAAGCGADAIAATPPSYLKPDGVEGVLGCLERIAEGAPDLPLSYYHIPRLTGVELCVAELLEAAVERLPSLRGVKYSEPALDDLLACTRAADGRYEILFGSDEMLLAGLATGAAGAVGSTYNFLGPLYRSVIDAFERGDLGAAREHQLTAVRAVREILRFPPLPGLKAAMALLGADCGPPRRPLSPLTAEEVSALETGLRVAGLALPARR